MSSGSGINSVFPPCSSFFQLVPVKLQLFVTSLQIYCSGIWEALPLPQPTLLPGGGEKEKWGINRAATLHEAGDGACLRCPAQLSPRGGDGGLWRGAGLCGKPSPPCINSYVGYSHSSCGSEALDTSMPCSSSAVIPRGQGCVLGGAAAGSAAGEAGTSPAALLQALVFTMDYLTHSQPALLLLHRVGMAPGTERSHLWRQR